MATSILDCATVTEQGPREARQVTLRPAGVAGSFYPADPAVLAAMMDGMLSQVAPTGVEGQILGVVAPHAGYEYSGPVAAHTYAALKGRRYERVVVIAPSHYDAFGFTSVYEGDGYITPLGTVPVDTQFARELAGINSSIQLSERGHRVIGKPVEHAIEVQLPWLQHVLGKFKLVPVVMGDQGYESSRTLGMALARLIRSKAKHGDENQQEISGDTLIIASSDLSHYHAQNQAHEIDRQTLKALEDWGYLNLSRNFESRKWEACGGAPILAAMAAVQSMGADQARVLRYGNSGEVSDDRLSVVGYGAVAFVKTQWGESEEVSLSLNHTEQKDLLELAQNAVAHAVRHHTLYQPNPTGHNALDENRGVFVTLMKAGKLRGCVGYSVAAQPLYKAVRDTATLAALRDPRFPPVSEEELPQLHYEISVLSALSPVDDINQIEIGKHGLLVKNGSHEGLLLPQVPVEQRWDSTRFLQEICVKAGLSPDCWSHAETEIFRFTALVIGGPHPHALSQKNRKAISPTK